MKKLLICLLALLLAAITNSPMGIAQTLAPRASWE